MRRNGRCGMVLGVRSRVALYTLDDLEGLCPLQTESPTAYRARLVESV
jgi:hypothetical protein